MQIVTREARLGEIVDLRHRILRGGLPRETAIFAGDDAPTTVHLAACAGERIVGCASLHLNQHAGEPAWQLRGMAVEEGYRGAGVGRMLLDHAERVVRQRNGSLLLWCNAREHARGFYEKHGWVVRSDVFDVPTAGPHIRMAKRL